MENNKCNAIINRRQRNDVLCVQLIIRLTFLIDFLFCYLQGWLVDLINKFGTLNGFQILHDRFMSGQALNVQIIAALIK